MDEKLDFIRLPLLLVAIFFVGRLALGAAGASYDIGNRLFSMVILQVHLALLWPAVGRRYRGYGIRGSIMTAVLIVLVSQALIWSATALSYLAGIHTYFNDPVAINGNTEPIGFGAAMISRTITFVANCVFGAILGAIGWALGGLIPGEKVRS
jgi:hypothetical protein